MEDGASLHYNASNYAIAPGRICPTASRGGHASTAKNTFAAPMMYTTSCPAQPPLDSDQSRLLRRCEARGHPHCSTHLDACPPRGAEGGTYSMMNNARTPQASNGWPDEMSHQPPRAASPQGVRHADGPAMTPRPPPNTHDNAGPMPRFVQ